MPAAAVLLASRKPPVYQASAEVLLSRQNLATTLNGLPDPTLYQQAERVSQTQAEIARVPAVAERVIEATGIKSRTAGGLLASSSVRPRADSDLLVFRVNDLNPAFAARLATAYAGEFTEYKRELDTAAIVLARREVEARIRDLVGDGDETSPLYESLVEKEQQLRTMEALQTANAYVVRPADGAFQVAPTPVRDGILAFAFGLVLGIALAFVRDALDTRIRSVEEIGEQLGLPLLARVPEPPRQLRNKNRLVMLAQPGSAHAEAFRMLRTNLEFVNLERGARTIMVTSAVEAEGKSTTAANLAVALARTGVRVALVDLDLRRPLIDRFFGLGSRPGLTDVALGHASLEDAVATIAVARREGSGDGNGTGKLEGALLVLASGPVPPDPGEFVGNRTIDRILGDLREYADMVIVDAPPLLHVGDAMTLSAKVDAVMVVTRLNVVRRPMLKELHRVLGASPALKLGFVLTGSDLEEGYGYGGYYRRAQAGRRERERVA